MFTTTNKMQALELMNMVLRFLRNRLKQAFAAWNEGKRRNDHNYDFIYSGEPTIILCKILRSP